MQIRPFSRTFFFKTIIWNCTELPSYDSHARFSRHLLCAGNHTEPRGSSTSVTPRKFPATLAIYQLLSPLVWSRYPNHSVVFDAEYPEAEV